MNDSAISRDQTDAVTDACSNLDRIEEERVLTDEVSDGALEAAGQGPTITFTVSIVLFACRFC